MKPGTMQGRNTMVALQVINVMMDNTRAADVKQLLAVCGTAAEPATATVVCLAEVTVCSWQLDWGWPTLPT